MKNRRKNHITLIPDNRMKVNSPGYKWHDAAVFVSYNRENELFIMRLTNPNEPDRMIYVDIEKLDAEKLAHDLVSLGNLD
jgi:hypothetical protein